MATINTTIQRSRRPDRRASSRPVVVVAGIVAAPQVDVSAPAVRR
jgi:hypothetical protein